MPRQPASTCTTRWEEGPPRTPSLFTTHCSPSPAVMGINLDTLRPEPCVEGYTTPGGYSSKVSVRKAWVLWAAACMHGC